MPKETIDYSNTVIYVIQHTEKKDLIYVGHTTNLKERKSTHKRKCKTNPAKLYQMIKDNGGWDAFEMKPIKQFSCSNSIEARIEEEKCRIEYNASLNFIRAIQTDESRAEVKEKNKKYYHDHKEEAKINKAEYYKANKEKFLNKAHANYQKKTEIFTCKCGGSTLMFRKARHEQSKMHIKFFEINGIL